MASSINSDQSIANENFDLIAATKLQKFLNDDVKSTETAELTALTTKNDPNIDHILRVGDTGHINNTIVDDASLSSQSLRTINGFVQTFDSLEEHLFSTCNSVNTTIISDTSNILADSTTRPTSPFILSTGEQQSQAQGLVTTIDDSQKQTTSERHIMISYNHNSSFGICQKICHKLRNLGYKVWMDEDNLHGVILEGMARGIENSYIVLMCYNDKYAKSAYCKLEATYTFEKRIDFIPCRLQSFYKPDGWLGIIISDRIYIDFSSSNDFDNSFKNLVDEIKHIESQSKIYSNHIAIPDKNHNVQVNNEIMRNRFKTITHEYKESINKRDYDLNLLEKEELCQLIIRLRERLFDDSDNDNKNCEQSILNNDKILRDLSEQARNQTELLRKMTEILSKLTDFKTIIKLSLAFLFLWTVKTHIIDVYIKYN